MLFAAMLQWLNDPATADVLEICIAALAAGFIAMAVFIAFARRLRG
jgi:hypothetical protein